MKLTPLVLLAAMRIPVLTDKFSDTIEVDTLDVVTGGLATITCAAPHGFTEGDTIAVAIIDAMAPNPITAWESLPNNDVLITVGFPHIATTTPDATNYTAWNAFAVLTGTGITELDTAVQLASVPSPTTLVVRPGGAALTLPAVPPGASLLERLEREIVGWQAVNVVSETELQFETPASVTRSYAIAAPRVATNIRTWGAVDLEQAMSHYIRDNEVSKAVLDQGYLFVCPSRQTKISRDRGSRSDANTEITPASTIRQLMIDGFDVYAVLPAERYGGAVACIDACQGPILTAVLRTFNGLRLPFKELTDPNPHVAFISSHGKALYNRANYVHRYTFEASAYLTNADCIMPFEAPDLSAIDDAIQNGDPVPTSIQPTGTAPLETIAFAPAEDGYGIFHKDLPQPLVATLTIMHDPED